jgi:hypothetical protein
MPLGIAANHTAFLSVTVPIDNCKGKSAKEEFVDIPPCSVILPHV